MRVTEGVVQLEAWDRVLYLHRVVEPRRHACCLRYLKFRDSASILPRQLLPLQLRSCLLDYRLVLSNGWLRHLLVCATLEPLDQCRRRLVAALMNSCHLLLGCLLLKKTDQVLFK